MRPLNQARSAPASHYRGTPRAAIGYQCGFGPITWVMISETTPLHSRARALAMATTLSFGLNIALTLSNAAVAMLPNGLTILFALYGVMCVISLAFVEISVPETKGLSLEAIEVMMRG